MSIIADAAAEPLLPLRDRVYRELRAELMNGTIPLSQRLTEPKLAARFGVSRTPVREALATLCADGLLRREDYGFAPVQPSIIGVRDLYEVRLAVELAGIRRIAENPEDPDIDYDRPRLELERGRWRALALDPPPQRPEFVVEDEKFHLTLLAAAGNDELVKVLESVNSRIRHVRMYDFMVNMRIETTIVEHLGILDAVLASEYLLAQDLLRRHIGESLDVVLARVTKAITAMRGR